MPGVINDPSNLSLRRNILAFGTDSLCSEMQKRNVPLMLRDGDPTIGRFYTTSCFAQELETGELFIQFAGFGYAWSNVTQRLGFDASAALAFDYDFQMHGSTMYVYFRQRSTSAQKFDVGLIEQPVAGPLGAALQTDPQTFASNLGKRIMETELARGFTVIRESDGSVSFGMGIIPPGQKPPAPYQRIDDERVLLVNERTEIHQNQRDFVGPLEVVDDDMALTFTVALEGAPAVDVLLVPRSVGDQWLQTYTHRAGTDAPPSLPLLDEPVHSGGVYRRAIAVPKGLYYLVIDNTATAGQTAPTTHALDDRAAAVSLAVELGDEP